MTSDEPAAGTAWIRHASRLQRGLVVLGAVVVVGALGWLSTTASPTLAGSGEDPSRLTVTEAEARAFLDEAITAGLARDLTALCALNGAVRNCRWTLEQSVAAVPAERPAAVTASYVERRPGSVPGWMLTVTGRDGNRAPYETQVMVFRDDEGDLKAVNVVWWSGARLVLDNEPSEPAQPAR